MKKVEVAQFLSSLIFIAVMGWIGWHRVYEYLFPEQPQSYRSAVVQSPPQTSPAVIDQPQQEVEERRIYIYEKYRDK